MKLFLITSSLLSAAVATSVKKLDATTYPQNAICTADQLMRYYQTTNAGLWQNYWFQSGFALGVLADTIRLVPNYGSAYSGTWQTTLTQAPGYGGFTNFINSYTDDEGWWANGWVAVYDLTQDEQYLNAAITIFNDISNYKTSCGGIIWEKNGGYIASISNELYIFLAASLANRASSNQATYLNAAEDIWNWFFSAGDVGSDGYVQDGVNLSGCQVTGDYYSYNQGVILGAAAELYLATNNQNYLTQASQIADANVAPNSKFNNGNDIQDDCTSGCDTTGQMFKGAWFRGLGRLNEVAPDSTWTDYLTANAQSLWNNDLTVTEVNGEYECNTGPVISGPPGSSFDAVEQASALALLNAAIIAT